MAACWHDWNKCLLALCVKLECASKVLETRSTPKLCTLQHLRVSVAQSHKSVLSQSMEMVNATATDFWVSVNCPASVKVLHKQPNDKHYTSVVMNLFGCCSCQPTNQASKQATNLQRQQQAATTTAGTATATTTKTTAANQPTNNL